MSHVIKWMGFAVTAFSIFTANDTYATNSELEELRHAHLAKKHQYF